MVTTFIFGIRHLFYYNFFFFFSEGSFRKNPFDFTLDNRQAQETGSSSRTSELASVPSKADSWEKSQINKIRIRSNFILT